MARTARRSTRADLHRPGYERVVLTGPYDRKCEVRIEEARSPPRAFERMLPSFNMITSPPPPCRVGLPSLCVRCRTLVRRDAERVGSWWVTRL